MTDTITLPRSAANILYKLLLSGKFYADYDESSEMIGKLRAALAQQAEQGWASLNDGLPKPHQMVLVARGKFVTTGSYSPEFGWEWEQLDGEDDDSLATHWMPLPAAPKGGV